MSVCRSVSTVLNLGSVGEIVLWKLGVFTEQKVGGLSELSYLVVFE